MSGKHFLDGKVQSNESINIMEKMDTHLFTYLRCESMVVNEGSTKQFDYTEML